MKGCDRRWALALVVVAILSTPVPGRAGTWRVEKDGSGDFTIIQHAVEAAADGDTIMIGPGRFDDYEIYDTIDGTLICYVYIPDKSLSLFGSGMGSTVIGPSSEIHPVTEHERGINSAYYGSGELVVADLTVEHVYSGIGVGHRSSKIQRCEFRNHSRGTGLVVVNSGHNEVSSCVFWNYMIGIFPASCDELRITDTTFRENFYGINSTNATGIEITNCTFEDYTVGVQLFGNSAGIIRDCTLRTNDVWGVGVVATDGSTIEMQDTEIRPGGVRGIEVDSYSLVTGSGNIIAAGTGSVIAVMNADMSMTGSHILPDGGLAVKCTHLIPGTWTIDLRGNWWGMADATAIAAMIHDGNDNPGIPAIVLFEPFADGEVPNESMSWGSLKNAYR